MKAQQTWQSLQQHYQQSIKNIHLRDLLQDQQRNSLLHSKFQNLIFDYTHQKVTPQTITKHFPQLIQNSHLWSKLQGLFNGNHINFTQDRAVLHTLCRAPVDSQVHPQNQQMQSKLKDVHQVLNRIKQFTNKVRAGEHKGASNKELTNLIVIGIGGSYLSIEFVYEALKSHPTYSQLSKGRTIRFLANVDPIDFQRAIKGLDAQSTLILINSKTFTTAQTILNAKSIKTWLLQSYQHLKIPQSQIISKHICACSTNLKLTGQFGIQEDNVFGFWDWVGGRFSVWSAIGVLPLAVVFGFQTVEQFLKGGHSVDSNFIQEKNIQKNIPLLLGLIGFYRTMIQNYSARAIVPYCQALCKFAPHIQQLDMQSNGKRINRSGQQVSYQTAVVNFGQPGTNGQHSFFQLLHQGRTIPIQFIGFTRSQHPYHLSTQLISNHDQLMSNFFSQPDALAEGKTKQTLIEQKEKPQLIAHKEFKGDRPTSSLLWVGELDAYKTGQLLAIYQHRTSVEGFLFDVNSYDQFGVQLGKVLAKRVRNVLTTGKFDEKKPIINSATTRLLKEYLNHR